MRGSRAVRTGSRAGSRFEADHGFGRTASGAPLLTRSTTVSLVLGSGGARGLAHIGVIQWLTENGYDIRSIAGSSMGALVGGIYATAKIEVYAEWVLAIRFSICEWAEYTSPFPRAASCMRNARCNGLWSAWRGDISFTQHHGLDRARSYSSPCSRVNFFSIRQVGRQCV